ncbi:MAG: MtrB/PioB family outer membrane beta-barrel protein [Acidobacteria bacterium]|nr:MtrB/PioB family outer membrane beta-barrel protein [Acidobacteriota bacterium]
MRIRALLLTIPIALVPAVLVAQAPTQPQPAAPAGPSAQAPGGAAAAAEEVDEDALPTTYGTVDFGVRTTSLSGPDRGARYERYRDLGDGLFLDRGRYSTQQRGWLVDLGTDHLGRSDQRFTGRIVRPGQVKIWAGWDQIPMLMSRTTRTLFTASSPAGVLEIPNEIQSAVQAQPASLAGFVQNARQFDLKSQRHIFTGGGQYIATSGITITGNVRQINRDGAVPFGGSFGHSQVVETLAPVKHQTTDFDSNAEYQRGSLLVRGGYTGSWFRNDVTSLTFDNPFRVTDISTAGSRGRAALAPSNSFVGVNGMVSYKLPRRSRVTATLSAGSLTDSGAALLPMTVNTTLATVALARPTTEGKANTSSVNLAFTSRPTRTVDVDVRYRTYDYDNRTPEFLVTQRVGFDSGISSVTNPALQLTEPFGVKRETFDADVRLVPIRAFSAGVGFSHQREERTHRIFERTDDNTIRFSVDSIGNRWVTLRSKYEHSQKRGEGNVAEIAAELLAIGEQPGLRHFDIASRNRDRGTIQLALTPLSTMSVNASVAAGKDDYLESLFGLRDNSHRVYTTGVDFAPSEYVTAGLSYSFEQYKSLSRSRQANPGVQFDDPSRNWATNTTDRAHSVIAHLELLQLVQNLDVQVWADHSRTRGLYRYTTGAVVDRTLPEEVVVPTSLPDPTQLPPVTSGLTRGTIDVTYALSERWSVGLSTWYERYRVRDFSLDAEALSRLDPAGALLLGYQYLPYTATTLWGRAIYKF